MSVQFTPMKLSVLTAQGHLSNVRFMEEDLIHVVKATGRIQMIHCNYGSVYNDTYVPPVIVEKKTKRGRKRKLKKRDGRKKQGNGKHFNSQITFHVICEYTPNKTLLVKLFRNGTSEIPGGLISDLRDIRSAANVVAREISDSLGMDCEVEELYAIMRNYKFCVCDQEKRVNLEKLFKLFVDYKNDTIPELYTDTHLEVCKYLLSDISVTVIEYLIDVISEVKFNVERYPGLIIKFKTPTQRNANKQTTIKMFRSGKINIDGATTEDVACNYFEWLRKFYTTYSDDMLFTPLPIIDSDSDSDSDTDKDDGKGSDEHVNVVPPMQEPNDQYLFEIHDTI